MGDEHQALGTAGPGVDIYGNPVLDPTKNVLDLVQAAIKRQDDLRESESRHVREIATLRAEYQSELRRAETERIDAIRAVDVGAVQQAAQVSATQATTLAAQVATSAETLRTQVQAAATASTVALAAALEPIQKDIADLRRAQYEAQGQKTQVVETRDAAADLLPLVQAIANLEAAHRESIGAQAQRVENRSSTSVQWQQVGVVIAALAAFAAVLFGLVK